MPDIIVNLATGYEKQGYANPSSVEITEGDRIIFHPIDSSFKVTFSSPEAIKDSLNNIVFYKVPLGEDTPTEKFNEFFPPVAEYEVEILSVADNNKGQAKMTVKAIITRNR